MTKQERYHKRKPWVKYLIYAKRRCNDKRHRAYKFYGARSIRCLLTVDDVRQLWHESNAARMKRPSLDRIDSSLSYTFENCRFIEFDKNVSRPAKSALLA